MRPGCDDAATHETFSIRGLRQQAQSGSPSAESLDFSTPRHTAQQSLRLAPAHLYYYSHAHAMLSWPTPAAVLIRLAALVFLHAAYSAWEGEAVVLRSVHDHD